ncbi:MAG: class I SAM-dependent methyltransferase [Crocinitomicaceae bacterium]|nr:class I SAM-dependent methyltransferase [Crocinitomicaceae bacterium]
MYTNKELEEIYDARYSEKEAVINEREVILYRKLKNILLPKDFLAGEVTNLDLGCGRGHKTVGFTNGFKRVLAVDLSGNVIEHCKAFYQSKENIEFKAVDAAKIEEKFNLITAFGFSLFNTPDNDKLLSDLQGFTDRNLKKGEKSFFILGSFTDFTGKGEESWYLHTKEDLKYIRHKLQESGAKVKVIFTHKKMGNYFGAGFYNFMAECYKLVTKRKKTFFIVIEHG